MRPTRLIVILACTWCVGFAMAMSAGCHRSLTTADVSMRGPEPPANDAEDNRAESGDEDHKNEDAANAPEVVVAMGAADVPVSTDKGGAQVWSENCMRCHNIRRPSLRSDREWATIVHHMRVRANLTAEEHRLIVRFLQAAN